MGFFDALFGNKQLPTVTSILPAAAKQEIMAGRLPILNADTIFPKKGERIHFIDKAMNMIDPITRKDYVIEASKGFLHRMGLIKLARKLKKTNLQVNN